MKSFWSFMGWVGFAAMLMLAGFLGNHLAVHHDIGDASVTREACRSRLAFFQEFDPSSPEGRAEFEERYSEPLSPARAAFFRELCAVVIDGWSAVRLAEIPPAPPLPVFSEEGGAGS